MHYMYDAALFDVALFHVKPLHYLMLQYVNVALFDFETESESIFT